MSTASKARATLIISVFRESPVEGVALSGAGCGFDKYGAGLDSTG